MNFNNFLKLVSKINNIPLPAEVSHVKMSPPYRLKLIKMQKEKIKNAKQSAVLALFYPDEEQQTKLVLILRKTYKGVHSAQVGFPGGKPEKQDDSLQETALRETEEEIGVSRKNIHVIREFSSVYIPPSNFQVYPFIGVCKKTPCFVKQENEVEELIEVSLQDFLNPKNLTYKTVSTSYNIDVEVPAFNFNNYLVWGATAMMLSELKDLLKKVM